MRTNVGSVLARVTAVVAVLLLIGIVLRLIVAILAPVLPGQLSRDLMAGWDMLYGIVAPAMAPVMAVGILTAIIWIVIGRGR